MPPLDNCLARSLDRSLVWMDKVIRSVQMFLEYLQCHQHRPAIRALVQGIAERNTLKAQLNTLKANTTIVV